MTGKRARAVARLLLTAGAWLCVAVAAVRADVPGVTATLSDNATTVGEPVELQIIVTGSYALGRVQPAEVDGLTIQARGISPGVRFGTSGIVEQNSYLFLIIPQRPGLFTLPETDIQAGGRKLRTPALTLSVTANPGAGGGRSGGGGGNNAAGAQVRAELLLPKRAAYVGEALPAEFRLSFGPRVELVEPSDVPLLPGEGFAVGRWTQPQATGARGFGGSGGGGNQRLLYKSIITGARPGTLSLGPGETVVVVRVPSARARANDPFSDDPLGGLLGQVFSPPRQIKVRADPVTLEVRPLPTAGQPADFTGGVGRFELGPAEVVSPARGTPARAGDPVVVRLTVRGQGSFDRLGAPLPDSADGLSFYEPKDRFRADDDVGLNGTKTFEQTFIPAGPRDSMPGFHLSYFDPVSGTYQGLRTPPVPLKILPGPVAAAVVPAAPAAPVPGVAVPPPAAAAGEMLRPLRPDPGVPVAAGVLRPVYARPDFWRWQLAPLGLLAALVLGLWVRARSRDVAGQRRAARAREQERLWRTVRDPHASRRAFLDAAVRLLGAAPDGHEATERIRARHAELAYGGSEEVADDAGTVSAGERAEVLTVLREIPSGTRPAAPGAPLLRA